MIKSEHDDIEPLLIYPIYRTETFFKASKSGAFAKYQKDVLFKEVKVHRWFRKESIIGIQEYVTTDNKIAKTRCLVLDKYSNQFFAVFHSVSDVRSAIRQFPPKTKIGFPYGGKV